MTERSAISQIVQVGVEATSGTSVHCRKRLTALSISPAVNVEINQFRPMGQKYKTFTSLGKDWSTAPLTGQATYSEIIYPLSSVVDAATVTTPGGATNARLWTFESDYASEDAPKTFTVEQGSAVRAHKFTYGIVNEFGISFSRSEVGLTGQMLGRKITDNITLSAPRTVTDGVTTNTDATVTSASGAFTAADVGSLISGTGIPAGSRIVSLNSSTSVEISANATASATGLTLIIGAVETIPLTPVLGKQVSIYLDSTTGGLGGTKLTRVLSANWSLGNRYGPLWVVDAAQDSFVTHVEVEPNLQGSIVVEADSEGMAILTAARASTRKFMRIQAVGDEIESGQNYTLTIDMAVEVSQVGSFSDQDGVFCVEYTYTGVTDGTWGKAFTIGVKNAQTAL